MKHPSEKILQAVLDTYMYCGIRTFPVDILKITEKIGYQIKTYTDFCCGEGYTYTLLMERSKDGQVRKQDHLILINDEQPRRRIRFTIAHEIGHIVMPKASEEEADLFASCLLAPPGIIYSRRLNTADKVSDFFDISLQAANMVIQKPDFSPYINGFDKETIRWFGDEKLCPDLFPENWPAKEPPVKAHEIKVNLPRPESKEEKSRRMSKVYYLRRQIRILNARMRTMSLGDEDKYVKTRKKMLELSRKLDYYSDEDWRDT